ncbi:CAP domain-containing protein [Clostridium sp. WILCCON 0269]|uniref:CAP domain-containing protein n=1 Tax=Candidatus Clostridium eludens TaxID=3381663 RepID=A0ABW8SRZ1_9CLOT
MNKKIKSMIAALIIAGGIPTIMPTMAKAAGNTCNTSLAQAQQTLLKYALNNCSKSDYSQLKNCTIIISQNTAKCNAPTTAKPSTNNNQTTTTTQPKGNNGQTSNTTKPSGTTGTTGSAGQASNISAEASEVIRLVNVERSKNGLSALKANNELSKVATIKAQDMIDKGYFDHTSPTYGSPFDMMKKFGISYTAAGENIAYGQKNAAEVMNSWMNSPGHRANILNSNFTEIGVGVAKDKNGTPYWVQMFINPGK